MTGLLKKITNRFQKQPSKIDDPKSLEEKPSEKKQPSGQSSSDAETNASTITQKKSTSQKTSFFQSWNQLLRRKKLDETSLAEIEELLYTADFGAETTEMILEAIETTYKKDKTLTGQTATNIANKVLKQIMEGSEGKLPKVETEEALPRVICLIGVNGSGKTTTAAKLAHRWQTQGQKCLLGACDTFRAAANEQIKNWAQRLNIDLVSSQQNADPAAVAFDAYNAACSRNCDSLILDTAGRLHTKSNLLNELQKLCRVLKKQNASTPHHIWLVADASLGTNTIEQAQTFHKELKINGLIITKMDGTSKGGALVGIYKKLNIPIYFIGSGEQPEDLSPFSAEAYIDSIFPKADSV